MPTAGHKNLTFNSMGRLQANIVINSTNTHKMFQQEDSGLLLVSLPQGHHLQHTWPASNQRTREPRCAPRSGCSPWSYPTSRPQGTHQPPPCCLPQNGVIELKVGCPTRQSLGPWWPHLGGDATNTAVVLMVPPPDLPRRAYSLTREGSWRGHQRYFLAVPPCFSACNAKHGSKQSNKSLGHRIDP